MTFSHIKDNENAAAQPVTSTSAQDPPLGLLEKTIGFPKSDAANAQAAAIARPTNRANAAPDSSQPTRAPKIRGQAAPKRPKGRWFISLFIFSVVAFAGNKIWFEFFEYQAFGVLEGRVVELRIPWAGVVDSLHVRDGDQVEQGKVLATINNVEFQHQRLKLKQDLQIALAGLTSRIAEIKSNQRLREDSALKMQVDYFQLLGRYHQERAKVIELSITAEKNEKLWEKNSVSHSRLETNRIELASQRALVSELKSALDKMRENQTTISEDVKSVIGPLSLEQAKIRAIETEFDRLGQLERFGEIRAPVNGRIVRRHHFSGEFLDQGELIFELLEEGSLEAVIYVPQNKAHEFHSGSSIALVVPPYKDEKTFIVSRVGNQMMTAPKSIQRFYNAHQKLVPVHAYPRSGELDDIHGSNSIWLGAEVRLPRFRSISELSKDGSFVDGWRRTIDQLTQR